MTSLRLSAPLTFDPTQILDQLPADRPVSSAELLATGASRRQIAELVAGELLRHPVAGVYVLREVPDDLETRIAVVKLVVPEHCVITDRTAAWVWGATTALAPGDHLVVPLVSVFCPPGYRLRRELTASGERQLSRTDIDELDGLRITTPLRTACDLGRLLHRDSALAALDALAALGAFTALELLTETKRFKGYRGVIQLRALGRYLDPRSGSPMESVLRLRWYDAGLPRPECQVPVAAPGGREYLLDIGLPDERFGAEYDGEAFHGEDKRPHDDRRRAWLREQQGWRLVIARKADVIGQHQGIDSTLRRAWNEHQAARATR